MHIICCKMIALIFDIASAQFQLSFRFHCFFNLIIFCKPMLSKRGFDLLILFFFLINFKLQCSGIPFQDKQRHFLNLLLLICLFPWLQHSYRPLRPPVCSSTPWKLRRLSQQCSSHPSAWSEQ